MAPKVIWSPFEGSQKKFLSCPVWECLLHGNRGGGKKMPNYYRVLRERGWTKLKDLCLGDLVYARDGKLYPVTGIFPQGISTIYKMTLQDGRVIKCGDEHLWSVVDTRMNPKVINTIDMLNAGLSTGPEGKKQYKFRIPNCESIPFNEKVLPIDPYLLGCLISEGALTSLTPRIATTQQHILNRFAKLYSDFELKHDKSTVNNHTIVDRGKGGDCFPGVPEKENHDAHNRFKEAIFHLGLNVTCKHKFIPKIYKWSSIKQRMELLQGLMDTDGSVGKNGHSEFVSASKRLIKDVAWICRSLGIRCRIDTDKRVGRVHEIRGSVVTQGIIYRLYINTSLPISQVPEKLKRLQNKPVSNQQKYVVIVDIKKLKKKTDMVCISVGSPDHTYIVKDFIVTHNTDVLLMDYLQGVGVGYGADYKGLLLREATTELGDIISKTRKWIPRIFPTAKFNSQKKIWTFADGESLWLNYARVEDDYEQYHGHEYPWIGWEELTNHAVDTVYLKLMSCNRTSNPLIPKKYRATCNPSGPGHQWVKARFIDKCKSGRIYSEELIDEETGEKFIQKRTHLKSSLTENKAMLKADPAYKVKLLALTKDNKMLRDAWIRGSWDLISGGFFTDVWNKDVHILPPFSVPKSWRLYRSFDWGSSKPWAVTYAFETNGEQPDYPGFDIPYIPKDSMIICSEIYGWTGVVNEGDKATSQEIAQRVLAIDKSLLLEYGIRVTPGPADTSIWEVRDGSSIANNLSSHGCRWTKAYKGSGSRIAGWSLIRQMLGAAKRKEPETPHLYFFDQAQHHIRTLPLMQRDKKKPEDIDTDLEDHCFVYDTEIITDKGFEKIGDLVGTSGNILTINGIFVPYKNCRLIKKQSRVVEVMFSDNHKVMCTPDHKFLTTKGFIEAKDLTLLDTYCIVSKPKVKGNLLCKGIDRLKESLYCQKQNKNLMGKCIINVGSIFKKMGNDFIEKFGHTITVKYQKDLIFIIKNQLHITNYVSWKKCHKMNIDQCICEKEIPLQQNLVLMGQENGTKVRKVVNGTKNILRTQKKHFIQKLQWFVPIVERFMKVQEKMAMCSVQINVKHNGGKNQALMMLRENVLYVPIHLQLTNMQQEKLVQVNAHQNCVLKITKINTVEHLQDVYCLEVPKYHTFALKNGVISSNCMDSSRYLLARKLFRIKRKKMKV